MEEWGNISRIAVLALAATLYRFHQSAYVLTMAKSRSSDSKPAEKVSSPAPANISKPPAKKIIAPEHASPLMPPVTGSVGTANPN
jgi:hypothetical protein